MEVAPSGGQICNQFKWWHSGPSNWVFNFSFLKWIQIQFSEQENSSWRLDTLGSLCLWQCFLVLLSQRQTVLPRNGLSRAYLDKTSLAAPSHITALISLQLTKHKTPDVRRQLQYVICLSYFVGKQGFHHLGTWVRSDHIVLCRTMLCNLQKFY